MMNKNYLENVISKKKIFANVKKYIWVMFVCAFIGLGLAVLLINQEDEPIAEEDVSIVETMSRNIIVKLQWEKELETELDYSLRYEEIEEIKNIVATTDFMSVVNAKLEENDMELLQYQDIIIAEEISVDMINFYVMSPCEDERLLVILETTMDYILNKAINEYTVESYTIEERGELSHPSIAAGRYYFFPVLEDKNEIVVEDSGMSKYISGVVMVFLGVFVGALVILLLITLDKKIYSVDEIRRVIDLDCLGDCTGKNHNFDKSKKLIAGKCKVQEISKLDFATCSELENGENVVALVEYLKSLGISVNIVEKVSTNNEAFLDIVGSTVVLVVQSQKDTIDEVWDVYSSMQQVGIDIEGFVIK